MSQNRIDVYDMVTKRVIEKLEQGVSPWQKPWDGGIAGLPRNFSTTKQYRGINTWLLYMAQMAEGYRSPFWVTYKQARELGGNVRAGEKSPSFVVFFSVIEKTKQNEQGEDEDASYRMLRYTPVFNVDQCDGLNVPVLESKKHNHEIISAAQSIVDSMPNRPTINIKPSGQAFYRYSTDEVQVPELSQFEKPEFYYSTLFHELGHSTRHEKRLARDTGRNEFGDHKYSKEELVAEFTASYLCGICGIAERTLDNSAAYLESWLKVLKDQANRKWLVYAASNAQKAADYIQGIKNEPIAALAA